MIKISSVVRFFAFALLLSVPGIAQPGLCPMGDDGFNIGCCQTPSPTLPQFPSFTLTADYACITSCAVTGQFTSTVTLGAPQMVLCDYAVIPINATIMGGGTVVATINGTLLGKYARTWTEPSPTGLQHQVWRFLVNGDLLFVSPGIVSGSCPVPPCSAPPINLPGHMVGHVDYACDPLSAVGWNVAMSLSHLPGCLSHAPFSARPLAGTAAHASISYHLVGPAPFTFGPTVEPQGPIVAESVRSSIFNWNPFTYQCQGEARVLQGGLATQFSNCLCSPVTPIAGPWKHQTLNGVVCCGSVTTPFSSIPLPGTVLPTGFVAQTLGTYTGATSFPGTRDLTLYVGVLNYPDPCQPANISLHVVTGVGTSRVPGQLFPSPAGICPTPGVPMVTTFVDLQNMLLLPPAVAAAPAPGIGALFASTVVWNLNNP